MNKLVRFVNFGRAGQFPIEVRSMLITAIFSRELVE